LFNEKITSKLAVQHQLNLFRDPPLFSSKSGKYLFLERKKILNFASNDYLGLADDETLKNRIVECFAKYPVSASSSRLVSGNLKTIREAELKYAEHFGFEDALFFPSGFQANLALGASLFDSRDQIFYDKHVHASLVNGFKLNPGNPVGYNHNSMSHLEKRLSKSSSALKGVFTESLFSMDGDLLPKDEFTDLKEKFSFTAIIDEAHSLGAMGAGGRGFATDLADITLGTFGKAFGLFGAVVLLPEVVREYLLNFASAQIYTTSLPPSQAAAASIILDEIKQADKKRNQLAENSEYMKSCLISAGFSVAGAAHIISVQIGNEAKALYSAKELLKSGFFVLAARFPTVPKNKAILRLGMSALHTKDEIETFVEKLKEIGH